MQELNLMCKKKTGNNDADFALDFEGAQGSKTFVNTGLKSISVNLINGGPTITTDKKINGTSSAIFGNTSGDCLSLSTAASFPGDFTIEAWVNQVGPGNTLYSAGFQMLVSLNRVLADMIYCLCLFENKIAFKTVSASGTAGTIAIGTTIVQPNVWTHLAFTRKDGIVQLWLNGNLEATSAAWTNVFGSSSAFYIGNCFDNRVQGTGGYSGMNGNIDRFRMYNRCLYTANFIPPTA